MVEDYALRKLAKKKRKREGADERGKRVRTKKNKVRRICRGQCYKEPFAVRRAGAADIDQDGDVQDDDEAPTQPKSKRRRKTRDSVKQSTSVSLPQHGNSKASHAAAQVTPASAALASFPASIQQFMQDQKLAGLTPIQERLASLQPMHSRQLVSYSHHGCLIAMSCSNTPQLHNKKCYSRAPNVNLQHLLASFVAHSFGLRSPARCHPQSLVRTDGCMGGLLYSARLHHHICSKARGPALHI